MTLCWTAGHGSCFSDASLSKQQTSCPSNLYDTTQEAEHLMDAAKKGLEMPIQRVARGRESEHDGQNDGGEERR